MGRLAAYVLHPGGPRLSLYIFPIPSYKVVITSGIKDLELHQVDQPLQNGKYRRKTMSERSRSNVTDLMIPEVMIAETGVE